MDFGQKQEILKAFGVLELIEVIKETEGELSGLEFKRLDFQSAQAGFIGSRSGDCEVVRQREAELCLQPPEFNRERKKATVDEKKAWLVTMRGKDEALKEAIATQKETDFLLEDFQLREERLKRQLTRMLSLLRVKEAQIRFLVCEI